MVIASLEYYYKICVLSLLFKVLILCAFKNTILKYIIKPNRTCIGTYLSGIMQSSGDTDMSPALKRPQFLQETDLQNAL